MVAMKAAAAFLVNIRQDKNDLRTIQTLA